MKKAASKWHILIAVVIPVLMGPIDASAVNVAFPSMSEYFKVSVDMVGWVSMSYLLVLSSFLLSFGRLGDMFGFKRIFLAGIAYLPLLPFYAVYPGVLERLFSSGNSGYWLWNDRGPSAAIITATFPQQERGKALGMLGTVAALGLATGPSLGGLLLDLRGWQTIFFS